jgi:hypothetical protein
MARAGRRSAILFARARQARGRRFTVASTKCLDLSAPAPSSSKGIWFGEHCFSEPQILPCSSPAGEPGLFAILVNDDTCHPRCWRALYFGESENVFARLTPWHEKYEPWCRIAGGAVNLYVAFLWMESSRAEERRAIVSALISEYQPECT